MISGGDKTKLAPLTCEAKYPQGLEFREIALGISSRREKDTVVAKIAREGHVHQFTFPEKQAPQYCIDECVDTFTRDNFPPQAKKLWRELPWWFPDPQIKCEIEKLKRDVQVGKPKIKAGVEEKEGKQRYKVTFEGGAQLTVGEKYFEYTDENRSWKIIPFSQGTTFMGQIKDLFNAVRDKKLSQLEEK